MIDDQEPELSERRTAPARSRRGRPRAPAGVPAEGEIVDGKYRIERVLGAGGMGVVVAAMHIDLGERVALKFVKVTEPDGDVAERLKREARITFRLRGKHVARLLDVGTLPSGAPFLVLEHLVGSDLAGVLEARGPLAITEAVDYVVQASVAIAEAHRIGIVHRDLKPSNLFETRGSDGGVLVKVLDFGVAKALGQLGGAGDAITTTTAVVGSPLYMSPEQVRGARNVDLRSDVWSLGVILHELLAAAPPFTPGPASAVCAAIAADEPIKIRTLRADVPAPLEALILRCLEKDAGKRFQSIGAFAAALARFAPESSGAALAEIAALAREPAPRDSSAGIERDECREERVAAAITGSPRAKMRLSIAAVVALAGFAAITALRIRGSTEGLVEAEARRLGAAVLAVGRPISAITIATEASTPPMALAPAAPLPAAASAEAAPAKATVPKAARPAPAFASPPPTVKPTAEPTAPSEAKKPTDDELELRATSRRH